MKPAANSTPRRARLHLRLDPELKRDLHVHAIRNGKTLTQLTLDFYRDTLKAGEASRQN